MPKKLLATTIILLLSISILLLVSVVNANFAPAQGLYIQGPGHLIYSGNDSSSIPLWVEAVVSPGASPVVVISYSVDDGANITLPKLDYTTYHPSGTSYNMDVYFDRNEKLNNLTNGIHTVRAYSLDYLGNKMTSDIAVFTVQKNGKTGIFLSGFPNGYPQPTTITPITPPQTMTQTPSIIPTTTSSSDYWLNSKFLTGMTLMVTLVAVASISLVYFRRRKNKLTSKQSFSQAHK